MEITFMELLVLAAATYTLTTALTEADGPLGAFYRLRNMKQAKVLECYLCSAVLVGSLFAIYKADNVLNWLITALALAGIATFAHKLTELDI